MYLSMPCKQHPILLRLEKYFITFNTLDVPEIDVEIILGAYENDQFFGPILKAMDGEDSSEP